MYDVTLSHVISLSSPITMVYLSSSTLRNSWLSTAAPLLPRRWQVGSFVLWLGQDSFHREAGTAFHAAVGGTRDETLGISDFNSPNLVDHLRKRMDPFVDEVD